MVLNHWNSTACAECLSSSMNNRKPSTNTEENSRCEADVTWSLSHGNLSLSKGLTLDCLREWLQKSLLMQLFIRNIFFKYCTSACCWEKGRFILAQREGSYGNCSKDVSKSLNFQFTCQHEIHVYFIILPNAFHFLQKKASLNHSGSCWWISAFHVPVESYSNVMFWDRNCLLVQILFNISWSPQRKGTDFFFLFPVLIVSLPANYLV